MTKMFSADGFVAERDIAGIILNRWGHAYISPQPGFHFGKDGEDAPRDVVKRGFGRIQFGHSELTGPSKTSRNSSSVMGSPSSWKPNARPSITCR